LEEKLNRIRWEIDSAEVKELKKWLPKFDREKELEKWQQDIPPDYIQLVFE